MATMQRRNVLAARADQDVALASEDKPTTLLDYTQIRVNGGTQMRAGLNEETAAEYADALRAGATLPPVVVFHDGSDYWLGDGFHRVRAHFMAHGHTARVFAEVRPGTRRDAILYAAAANADHGLRRTNADKRRAVEVLLNDDEWQAWSDREIARRCKVSHNFVSEMRRSLSSDDSDESTERTYTTRHGTTATMNVAGQRQAAQERKVEADDRKPLSLDATIAIIWQAIKHNVAWASDPATRRNWLHHTADMNSFNRFLSTPQLLHTSGLNADIFAAARERVLAELQGQIDHANQTQTISDQVIDDVDRTYKLDANAQPRALTTDETVAVIFKVLNRHERKPGLRHNWLAHHPNMADYTPALNPGFVLVESAFEAAYQRALLEVGDEPLDPDQVAAVEATMHIPDGDEAPTLPADLVALGCRLELDAGFYHVRFGGHRSEYASYEGAVAWCRRMTGTEDAGQAEPQGTRQERIVALIGLYKQVLGSLADYGRLTGDFTGVLPARRSLEAMVGRLEGNVTK